MKGQAGGAALLLLGLVHTGLAQDEAPSQRKIEFDCGGATVVIDSEPKGYRSPEEAFARTGKPVQAQIVATRGATRVAFQSWHDIDFIGGGCMQDVQGRPRIVYQAFCGGSGCDTLGNWGIIDPVSFRELLVPSDHNANRARDLLGLQPSYARRISLLSVE